MKPKTRKTLHRVRLLLGQIEAGDVPPEIRADLFAIWEKLDGLLSGRSR